MIKKKDIVYYTRIIPNCGIYDLCELKVRGVYDGYFTGIDKHDKHVFLLNFSDIDKTVFVNRKEALEKIKEAEKHKKIMSDEIYYEEY